MAQVRPKILLTYGRQQEPVRVPLTDLLEYAPVTYVVGSVTAGSNTLPVQNGVLGTYPYVIIGEPGSQNSELTSIASYSGNTLTVGTLVYSHQDSEPVYFVNFNQVEVSWNALATPVSNTVLATITINPYYREQVYYDSTETSGYYYARFKASSTYSPYSDPAPYSGYTLYSARSVIDKAKQMIHREDDTQNISDEFFFGAIDDCQIESLREFSRWSFMQKWNQPIGVTNTGDIKVAVPVDIDDPNTTKAVYNLRIGKESPLVWIDKEEWDGVMQEIAYTVLTSPVNIGDTVLNVASANDFPSTGGTVQCGPTTFAYTSTTSTTLILGSASTVAVATNTDVTLGASLGFPYYFTVWGGYAYFFPGIGSSYSGRNYYMDYYTKLIQTQNDSTLIVLPDPMVVQYYLAWRALLRINNGKENADTEAMYKHFTDRLDTMKKKEWINRKVIWKVQ